MAFLSFFFFWFTGVNDISVAASQFKEHQQHGVCEPCIQAKQHRLPFPTSDTISTKPLQLIHTDVCGPLEQTSRGGARYLATFLDDFSKLSTVEPVAQKSEVATKGKEVFQRLETQTGQKLQKVRTDRGGEYLNTELDGYYKSKGVVHQTTALYTPEQNGVAERFNRTLMERVRAMLLDAKLDKELWAEAAVTANYIKNRSPSSSSTQTPWELFYEGSQMYPTCNASSMADCCQLSSSTCHLAARAFSIWQPAHSKCSDWPVACNQPQSTLAAGSASAYQCTLPSASDPMGPL